MHRRQMLTAAGAGLATATAGCLGLAPQADDSHPLAGTTATVRIEAETESPHDLQQVAREALSFWDAESEQYADFSVSFEVTERDGSDVVISYADSARGCENVENYSERVMGCAPLLKPGQRVERPLTARVVASTRPVGQILTTTQHEIGHILGLSHEAEPREIMSNRPEDRIPEYAARIEIWETVQQVHDRSGGATRLLNHGIASFRNEEFTAATAAFEAASADFSEFQQSIEQAIERTAVFEDIERVETVALESLRTHLEQIRRRMAVAEQMTAALVRGADAAAAGNDRERDDAIRAAGERATAFNDIGPVQLREVAIALGLVRGYENEVPVVEIDDDDPAEMTGGDESESR